MSARNPTDFNAFVNMLPMRTGQQIITTQPSQVVDDQMFFLDKQELIVSQPIIGDWTASGSFVDKFVFYLDTKDMCGEAGVSNNEIAHSFYAMVSTDAGTTGEVRLTSGTATANTTSTVVVPDSATASWIAGDTINIKTNGNEDTLTVAVRSTSGVGFVYLMGIAIFADET